ncbi:leucine-rich melanocyte differentiation-associated protein-like isoform X3 [Macrobrachium rosenbergii]|uniref:leucine-rich melanocyte differentiation-associated protein-like isoform X3 n=1 Tax=Macrobrachium rosenbergii TaxID=79674 RepID=UPI0034D527B9
MLGLETYPAFYLGYINAYSPTSSSGGLSRAFTDNPTPCSRREGASYTPYECSACGVPLRIFRKCCTFDLLEERNMTAHLCITTYRSPNNEVLKLELCFVGQDCQRIPSILGATYGLQTKRLDLSYNAIKSLEGLEKFPHLEELILDNNFIDDSVTLPRLETLHTLSLNKNKVANLEKFLDQVSEKFPQLRYLSLLGNEACPNQLSSLDKDEKDYRRYRLYVLHRLHGLRFLDSTAVRKTELREARKRGALMKTVKPPAITTVPNTKTGIEHQNGTNTVSPPQETNATTKAPEGNKKQAQNGTAGNKENSTDPAQKHTGAYGVRRYRYIGKHSEGNRFIRNEHL